MLGITNVSLYLLMLRINCNFSKEINQIIRKHNYEFSEFMTSFVTNFSIEGLLGIIFLATDKLLFCHNVTFLPYYWHMQFISIQLMNT